MVIVPILIHFNDDLSIEPQTKYADSDIFDFVVCPNELCADRYRPFIDAHKIKVLGSARYSDEWLKIMPDLLPFNAVKKDEQEFCIVFFLRKNEFSLFWDEIKRVITMLLLFENVRVIIKPHTRDYLQNPLKNILKQVQSPRLEVARDDDHSVSLLARADVVIDIATSASFEAIKRNIPVLSADYLHAGCSAIGHYIPETMMHCRDDVYHAVHRFVKNPRQQFYIEKNRHTFIREMLDVPDKDTLERYVALLAGQTIEETQLIESPVHENARKYR